MNAQRKAMGHPALRRSMAAVLLGAGLAASAFAQGNSQCGPLANAYGPFDYRTQRGSLKVVEDFHFTPEVEALIGGKSGRIGGDLDYTLRASPNHHRALLAVARLGDRLKTPKVPDTQYTVDCYFERALRFQPDDTTARMLFVQHLARTGRAPLAVRQLEDVVTRAGDNGFTHYNAGLLYMELKQPDRALEQAHRAMALGFERPELRQALVAEGKWRDPPPAPAGAASAPAADTAPATPTATPARP